MSARIKTCDKCKAVYISNGRARYCASCGTELTDQGELATGFGRDEMNRYHHEGWCVFMAKMKGEGHA